MKKITILLIGVTLLLSCVFKPKNKLHGTFNIANGHIRESFYKVKSDTLTFKRILEIGKENVIQDGMSYLGDYAITYQKINTSQPLNLKKIDSLKNEYYKVGYTTKESDFKEVMFIQILPDSAMSDIEYFKFLNLRHNVESEIGDLLEIKGLGQWFAGDMGAGANMLFSLNSWNEANELVIEYLKNENLIDHVLIARRFTVSSDNWHYEIVYPLKYEGKFNSM